MSDRPDEYMCPHCVTPWRCNGPHVPDDRLAESVNPDPICPCGSVFNFSCQCSPAQIEAFKAGRKYESGRGRKWATAWKALAQYWRSQAISRGAHWRRR